MSAYYAERSLATQLRAMRAPLPTVEARAAQLTDAWLRGYLVQGLPPLGLEEIADIAHAAREAAKRELGVKG